MTVTDRQRQRFAELPDRSPLLVVDLDVVAPALLDLVEALPGVTVFYAVKANPLPEVLRLLVELRIVLRRGVARRDRAVPGRRRDAGAA